MSTVDAYDQKQQLTFCILTVSDTRDITNDRGGRIIRERMEGMGHRIDETYISQDDTGEISSIIEIWLRNSNIDGIITTGGTGLGLRDVTPEAIEPFLAKKIAGFGELFRMIGYTDDVGTKALLSRAEAGVARGKVIYMLPGSVKAVELAMDKLILPELHHIIHEITKHLKV